MEQGLCGRANPTVKQHSAYEAAFGSRNIKDGARALDEGLTWEKVRFFGFLMLLGVVAHASFLLVSSLL